MSDTLTRGDYYTEVRDLADSIQEELLSRLEDGETGEDLREWLLEHIHECVDSHQWVIYTWHAKHVIIFSDNDGAYADEFGPEGMVEDGAIQWSRLAYAALQRDLYEQLDSNGVDVNDPEESDCFEEWREQRELKERREEVTAQVVDLPRADLVKILAQVGIESYDTEDDATLREAVIVNVLEGNISESELTA